MTVKNIPPRVIYRGTGQVVDFPIEFQFTSNTDIRVLITDDGGPDIPLTTGWSIRRVTDDRAVLVWLEILRNDQRLTIFREVQAEQQTVLENQGPYHPRVVEGGLDHAVMLIQQLELSQSLSVRLPMSSEDNAEDTAIQLLLARDEAVDAAARAEAAALDADAIEEAARRVAADASTANQAIATIAIQAAAVQDATDKALTARDEAAVSASSAETSAAQAAAVTAGVSQLADFLKVLDYGTIADASPWPEAGTLFDFGAMNHV